MKKILLFTSLLLLLSVKVYGSSTIFLSITRNLQEKADIALLLGVPENAYWKSFLKTLGRDLEYSGYFSVTELKLVENPAISRNQYTTGILLLGEQTAAGIRITLEDLVNEQEMFKRAYRKLENPTALAHKINDDIILHFTGKPGMAQSQVLFVSDITGKHQLYRIDYDGENMTRLTDTEHLVHFPRWLAPGREIVFVSYEGGWPKLVKKDLVSNATKPLISEPGLNACASPSLETGEMAIVLSRTGRPEVYLADFDGRLIKRLTFSISTDASPSFSPCGTMLAFVSDRHGSPQIYTMTRDGERVKRISFVSGYATSPAWSPDGKYIAYVFSRQGAFGIAVHEPARKETTIISEALGSEDISWAPDSRHLVYAGMNSSPPSLQVLDIITGRQRRLTPVNVKAFSPCWGYRQRKSPDLEARKSAVFREKKPQE